MSRVFVGLAALVVLAAPVLAAEEMILVYPGKPGTQTQAKSVLEAFTDYVEAKAGWGKGALHATYYNEEAGALQALGADNPPAWGILSLAIYLKWKKAGKPIELVAQSELDKKPTMQFHLLVPKESKIQNLGGLDGANVASSFLDDRQFATNIVFGGKVNAQKSIAIIDTKSISTALTASARFKALKDGRRVDALVVDDEQLRGLEGKDDFKKMRLVWSSDPLPTPVVVRFGTPNVTQQSKLLGVLTDMPGNAQGRKILEEMTTTGFREPNKGAYLALEKAY
ncbi:MAG: PhnD/SsuA/transferrin family substrate-binding protein [Planctomycetota bacterium]